MARVLEFQLQDQSFQWIFRTFSLGWTGWISLQFKGLSRVFSNTTVQKCQFFSAQCSAFFIIQLLHPYIATGKTIALTRWTFVDKVMSLLFNMLSRFVIAFLPRNKYLFYFFFQKTKDILWANAIDWALCTFWRMAPVLLLLLFLNFNLRLITLQYCCGFWHTFTWISHGCTCVPHPDPPSYRPPHPIPQGHPSAPALSTLPHASNLEWGSISHMIIYMFQCFSLKSSHPHLLPQSPKVCSLSLCLFCCLTYRVMVTIFLNSICMH